MGVISTGAIFKTLTFDGRSSSEFNVYITGEGVFNAPERAVEMISIPGRNGAFALDYGRFENIEVTYNCGIAGDDDTDFAEAVSDFRNWLCSRNGYVRLTDDYNTGEYRMAIYKSGLEVTATQLIAGEFPVVFECKPQRFLTSGEEKISVGEWGETTTETGDIVEIENPDGILSVKSLTADINAEQDLNGYPNPWPGGAGKNKFDADDTTLSNFSRSGTTYENSDTDTRTALQLAVQCYDNNTFLGQVVAGATPTVGMWSRTFTPLTGTNKMRIKHNGIDRDLSITFPFSLQEECTMSFNLVSNDPTTVGGLVIKDIQIEKGSTATAWTPYSNICPITGHDTVNVVVSPTTEVGDGTTYTTALGSTVYGGTLDVVSGELTLTHAIATFIGDAGESWSMLSNPTRFSINYNPSFVLGTIVQGAELICNEYMFNGLISSSSNLNNGQFVWFTTNNLFVRDDSCANVADWKTKLQNVPLQIVGKLATPTTTTLTAQQVELLLGTNNIWADTGNVAVEYGQNPNILVNPTLFESRPMLEVTGSGAVNLNDDTIQINNDPIGDVVIYSQNTKNTASAWTIPIETEFANTGDTIYVSRASYEVTWTLGNKYFNDAVVTSVTGPGTAGISVGSNNVYPEIWLQELQFTFGTSASYTVTADYSFDTQDYGTLTGDITLTLSYNGASQLSLSHSATRPTQFGSKNPTKGISDVILSSTKTALGNPLYIDLNIGEAYKIENNVPVSVNNGVVIPAELPTLAPGANMVTCDNTITQLDIVPRWWKI